MKGRNYKFKTAYLTPTEIIKKYPDLKIKFGWDARIIGILFNAKLLDGVHKTSERKSYVSEASLLKLVEYVNNGIDGQKVDINNISTLK